MCNLTSGICQIAAPVHHVAIHARQFATCKNFYATCAHVILASMRQFAGWVDNFCHPIQGTEAFYLAPRFAQRMLRRSLGIAVGEAPVSRIKPVVRSRQFRPVFQMRS